jgi:hypothetical protein
MTASSVWDKLAAELESQTKSARAGEEARMLKMRVENAISEAENDIAPPYIIDRLDQLLMILTEASRENVCANTKCPHYSTKCKMR